MKTNPKLLLWDIDGTLVWTGKAGEYAMNRALHDVFETEGDIYAVDYAGRTDCWIFKALMKHYQYGDHEEKVHEFMEAYLKALEDELPKRAGHVLEGVLHLLEWVSGEPHLHQGLLTGNLSHGAKLKLSHYDIWHFFEFGAFADDSEIRDELGPVAIERATNVTGSGFAPDDIYVIGDTPHDIQCGRAIGAQTIAVATGKFGLGELRTHQPDYAFANFKNPENFYRIFGMD
jgi:phosphoglycolate phosphatase